MDPEAPETSEEEHLAKRARHNLEGQDDSAGGEAVEAEGGGQDGSAGGEVETGNAEGGDGEEGTEEEGFSEQEEEEEEEEEDEDDEEDDDEEEAQDEEQQQQQQQLQEEEEEEIAAMQRVTDLLETCSEDQLHKLFFDAVMRYKDDILLGHDEARNDLLVSACVQHPDFEQQIEAICTENLELTATNPACVPVAEAPLYSSPSGGAPQTAEAASCAAGVCVPSRELAPPSPGRGDDDGSSSSSSSLALSSSSSSEDDE